MILIITGQQDGHVGPVSKHLDSAGVPWIRLNVENFATNVEVDIAPGSGTGRLWLKDSRKEARLEEIGAVWYRKPEPIAVKHFDLDSGALEYIEAEFTEIVLGLYALLSRAYWINNPFNTRIAHRKLLQLKVTSDVGFDIPRTVVTNRPEVALDFSRRATGDLAIKSLGAISVMQDQGDGAVQYGIFTRRISSPELFEFKDKIGFMPTLFQDFIRKKSELRITCVGNHVFACRIQTRADDISADDYRFCTTSLLHTAVERPDLTGRMFACMDAFGLNFAAFDFIESETGETIFLECNCNGQWFWVEQRTGQLIGEAIACQLIRHAAIDC